MGKIVGNKISVFKWLGIASALGILVFVTFLWFPRPDLPPRKTNEPHKKRSALLRSAPRADNVASSPIRLTLVTDRTGIDFVYYGGPTSQHYMTESNGGGVGLFDFDGDDLSDIFLPNGSNFLHPAENSNASQRLYRALGEFQYVDVTESAGLRAFGFGMGCTAGDYNNDGFVDLFVACYGKNRLWRNNGDGTFSELTNGAGFADEQWSTSAAFADLDGDGNLDLYVVNYVDWSSEESLCFSPHEPPLPITCSPIDRSGQADLLYRNLGDGRFEDVGSRAGIAIVEEGKGLAVAIADFDKDNRLDIYVANDTTRNFLFHNVGNFQFREEGIVKGVATSHDGIAGASMGIACADYNGDGRLDLAVTNFMDEITDIFANQGEIGFVSTNDTIGTDAVTRPVLSWGIVLVDFDLDRWPDLFIANGHVWDLTSLGKKYEYQMLPQIIQNESGKRLVNVSTVVGDYFHQRWHGRAVAFADLDNDGDSDLVVSHLEKPPAVLRNDSKRAGGSLRLKLIGTRSSRQPLGARVEVDVDGSSLTAWVPSGGSFQSLSDDRVLIATGNQTQVSEVRVFWPGGTVEIWRDIPIGGTVRLIEGTGR